MSRTPLQSLRTAARKAAETIFEDTFRRPTRITVLIEANVVDAALNEAGVVGTHDRYHERCDSAAGPFELVLEARGR